MENITFSGDYSNISTLIYFSQEIVNENSLLQIKNIIFQSVENINLLVDVSCLQIEISSTKINSSNLTGGFNILSNNFNFNFIEINNTKLISALKQNSFKEGLINNNLNSILIFNSEIGDIKSDGENFNMVGNITVKNFYFDTEINIGNCVLCGESLTDFDQFYLSDSSFSFGPAVTYTVNTLPICSFGLSSVYFYY